jgi:hypothetical protein
VESFACSGISIPHPEANYHTYRGKNVFFEVNSIDIDSARKSALASPDPDASLSLLAAIEAVAIRALARRILSKRDIALKMKETGTNYHFSSASELLDLGLGTLVRAVNYILRNLPDRSMILCSVQGFPASDTLLSLIRQDDCRIPVSDEAGLL